MNVDIQSEAITPRRHTYSHIARRFGADRPASRYEEATLDIQATANFHYRPTFGPEFELYDPARTRVAMADWYVFKDPRQLYYATYNMSRSTMQQAFDTSIEFVEKRGLLGKLDPAVRDALAGYLIPLRHLEWAANMNYQMVTDWGYGSQLTSAAAFGGADRLGLAQAISRIGLLLGEGGEEVLVAGKDLWVNAPQWQGARRLVEDVLVVRDWFETLVAQIMMDAILYPLAYGAFEQDAPTAVPLMTGFMNEWFADHSRWTDMMLKTAAAESAANAQLLSAWCEQWTARALEAALPLAVHVLGEAGRGAVAAVAEAHRARLATLGVPAAQEQAA